MLSVVPGLKPPHYASETILILTFPRSTNPAAFPCLLESSRSDPSSDWRAQDCSSSQSPAPAVVFRQREYSPSVPEDPWLPWLPLDLERQLGL